MSIRDELRRGIRARLSAMSPEERIALTAELAEWDLELFRSARGISRQAARDLLVRARRTGRLPSRVTEEIDR
jgi:hypothetical protein